MHATGECDFTVGTLSRPGTATRRLLLLLLQPADRPAKLRSPISHDFSSSSCRWLRRPCFPTHCTSLSCVLPTHPPEMQDTAATLASTTKLAVNGYSFVIFVTSVDGAELKFTERQHQMFDVRRQSPKCTAKSRSFRL